jgi:hypothetical protein
MKYTQKQPKLTRKNPIEPTKPEPPKSKEDPKTNYNSTQLRTKQPTTHPLKHTNLQHVCLAFPTPRDLQYVAVCHINMC